MLLPGQRADRKEACEVWVMEEVESEVILNVMNFSSHSIIDDSLSRWEGESGWVIQGIISRASFRRQPLSGQKPFTVMSLRINNTYVTSKELHGDAPPAPTASVSSKNPSPTVLCRCLPAPPPLWGPGAVLVSGQTCVDFSSLQTQKTAERTATRCIPNSPRSSWHPTDWSELPSRGMASLGFFGAINGQAHHERPEERRLLLKERSTPYHYSKQKYQTGKDASDHSLSS